MTEKIGMIAGNGQFPFLILDSARKRNIDVVVAAIKEEASPEIESAGFPVYWLRLGELGKLIRIFREAGVEKAVMAGQVRHVQIFSAGIPDLTMIKMLAGLKQKNTDSLIGGAASVLEENGIKLLDSSALIEPLLAVPGKLTRRGLNKSEQADVDYGRPIARKIAEMDIGQTIVVRNRAVVAVEAMEGTDAAMLRAGELARKKDLTVVKVSKPGQDMRFDIPVIGILTVENMIACGATALVIDAGRTLVFDTEAVRQKAGRHGIAIVALPVE